MRILSCVKVVPSHAYGSYQDNTIGRELILNPADLSALEEALALRDAEGGTVTVLSMCPAQRIPVLHSVLRLGVDHAYAVSADEIAGSDTLSTSRILAAAVRFLGTFDVIFCGGKTVDGETGQVGPQLAAFLGLPSISNCVAIRLSADKRHVVCDCMVNEGIESAQIGLPALLTVKNGINSPRLPSIRGLANANRAKVEPIAFHSLHVEPGSVGLTGSPTKVLRSMNRSTEMRSSSNIPAAELAKQLDVLIRQADTEHCDA